jgi:hypothetical protein
MTMPQNCDVIDNDVALTITWRVLQVSIDSSNHTSQTPQCQFWGVWHNSNWQLQITSSRHALITFVHYNERRLVVTLRILSTSVCILPDGRIAWACCDEWTQHLYASSLSIYNELIKTISAKYQSSEQDDEVFTVQQTSLLAVLVLYQSCWKGQQLMPEANCLEIFIEKATKLMVH